MQLLGCGEASVGELAEHFPVSRSAISQHLLLLATAGLVTARKDGRRRYYSLDPRGMSRLRDSLESFWTGVLLDRRAGPPGGRRRRACRTIQQPRASQGEIPCPLTSPSSSRLTPTQPFP
nr:metalloregulator ArsR/SmtB family transcription factor [Arthrobacter sp. SDTb3-6]